MGSSPTVTTNKTIRKENDAKTNDYDCNGRLKSEEIQDIPKGAIVEYVDAVDFFDEEINRWKTIKVKKYGIWDGKKVILNDKEKTLVRNKAWLKRVLTVSERIALMLEIK